jgi:arylsulfatase A-like enzyme
VTGTRSNARRRPPFCDAAEKSATVPRGLPLSIIRCDTAPLRALLSLAACAVFLAITGCRSVDTRPSIVLAVLDTVRVDDVSAYGKVAGTTPTVDALARSGLRYAHAYANASWTLPSHATLFTGLLPHEHGVRTGSNALPDDIPTLAERLRAAGYETVAISENPWIGEANHTSRGFEHYECLDRYGVGPSGPDISEVVGDWLRLRSPDRPFFLFVNIMDAHADYKVRDVNPFLPAGVTADAARHVSQDPRDYICVHGTRDADLAVLRGLYRGDVHAADAKLGRVLARIEGHPLTVVLSDHGECFGERGLFGHDIGLADALLHVPLVVHGLPGIAPAVIETPVQLADVLPSLLAWVGAPPLDGITGRALPTRDQPSATSPGIVSEYTDYTIEETLPEWMQDKVRQFAWRGRGRCGPADHVFGDMRSVVAFPYKLMSYTGYPQELFEVASDPREQHDLAPTDPGRVARLEHELEAITAARGAPENAPASRIDPGLADRLRALGYLGAAPRTAPP